MPKSLSELLHAKGLLVSQEPLSFPPPFFGA